MGKWWWGEEKRRRRGKRQDEKKEKMFQDNYWWEWWAGFLLLCLAFDWLVVWLDDLWVGSVRRVWLKTQAMFFSVRLRHHCWMNFWVCSVESPRSFCIYIQIIQKKKTAPRQWSARKRQEKICARKKKREKVDDFLFKSLIVKGLILLYGIDKAWSQAWVIESLWAF